MVELMKVLKYMGLFTIVVLMGLFVLSVALFGIWALDSLLGALFGFGPLMWILALFIGR